MEEKVRGRHVIFKALTTEASRSAPLPTVSGVFQQSKFRLHHGLARIST